MRTRSLIAAGPAYRERRRDTLANGRLARTVIVAIVLMAAAAFPTAGFGVVTIGSDLAGAPDASYEGPGSRFTFVQDSWAGRPTTSPVDGVVVRWRIRTDGGPTASPFTLRVVRRPGIGVATGPTVTPAVGTTVNTFDARIPIKAGELIGVDQDPTSRPPPTPGQPFGAYLRQIPSGSGTLANWEPFLADGQTRAADVGFTDAELLVNADIEPDADTDAFGDETQDRCKTDAIPAGGVCTPPQLQLGGKTSQRALKKKGIVVEVGCPTEACAANASGTVAVPGAAKVFKLRPATKRIAAGGKAKLKLKFAKKTLKAVKRALAKRKKIKAKVTVTVKDAGGNATTKKQTVKLKR